MPETPENSTPPPVTRGKLIVVVGMVTLLVGALGYAQFGRQLVARFGSETAPKTTAPLASDPKTLDGPVRPAPQVAEHGQTPAHTESRELPGPWLAEGLPAVEASAQLAAANDVSGLGGSLAAPNSPYLPDLATADASTWDRDTMSSEAGMIGSESNSNRMATLSGSVDPRFVSGDSGSEASFTGQFATASYNQPNANPADPNRRERIEPRDSFWLISERAYGSGAYFRALYAHNQTRFPQPDQLPTGAWVEIPDVKSLKTMYPDLCPGSEDVAMTTAEGSRRRYVTQSGDTLGKVAERELGDRLRWTEIYRLNSRLILDHRVVLKPGIELWLPRDRSFAP